MKEHYRWSFKRTISYDFICPYQIKKMFHSHNTVFKKSKPVTIIILKTNEMIEALCFVLKLCSQYAYSIYGKFNVHLIECIFSVML